ncbi:terpene synthase family protein [Streptomyces sp. NPDC059134]|uniref:terpene synthase family protein n=1 Tax=Streptomyces sp. NPDC059134 TaxID=3346738 RepID=UPI0036A6568C
MPKSCACLWEEDDLVVKALADVLARIAPPMSTAWRRRLDQNLASPLRERGSLEMRRGTPTTPTAAETRRRRFETVSAFAFYDVVERAIKHEVPAQVLDGGPYPQMRTVAAKMMFLINDLNSLPKEIDGGDAAHYNTVAAHSTEEKVSLEQAADAANTQLNAYAREYLSLQGPLMDHLDTLELSDSGRFQVWENVRAVAAFLGGAVEWHLTAPRYREHFTS